MQVKFEDQRRRAAELREGIEATVYINLTDDIPSPASFAITDEQKPCPVCKHCVIITRRKQANVLHCGLGHCKQPHCLAEFCWECGEVLYAARKTRMGRGTAGHMAQLGGTGCEKREWW